MKRSNNENRLSMLVRSLAPCSKTGFRKVYKSYGIVNVSYFPVCFMTTSLLQLHPGLSCGSVTREPDRILQEFGFSFKVKACRCSVNGYKT